MKVDVSYYYGICQICQDEMDDDEEGNETDNVKQQKQQERARAWAFEPSYFYNM